VGPVDPSAGPVDPPSDEDGSGTAAAVARQ
jgi:hypothetical protein